MKYAAVTTWLYERLPAIAKFIFTTKQIDIMIESASSRMKEYLKNNASAEIDSIEINTNQKHPQI